ncbi:YtoQ family protein, partial [Bacillus altitudinis]
RPKELHHPLKQRSNKAHITVETVNQAIKALSYVFDQE